MWLSYIIPLYNCGEYIATCLDSVLAQGLSTKEYEIIVVNDGSTDNGAEIVSIYCKKHNNIRLINKENGGVSSARNRGIDEAKGEYVYFMDADDYLLPKGMKILKEDYLGKYGQADMIGFEYHIVDNNYNSEKWEWIHPHSLLFYGSFLDAGNKFGLGRNACFCIISRKLIKEHNIRFKPYVRGEDTLFMISLFCITDAIAMITNLNIYRYCKRNNSATTSVDKKYIEKAFMGGGYC